jgi:hypothetical protein
MPTVKASVPLRKGEDCFYEAPGSILEIRVKRSSVSGGRRHVESGLTIVKSGSLLITSKRIVLVSDGVSEIPLTKVMGINVECFGDWLLKVTKDSRESPVIFQTDAPLYAGNLIKLAVRNVPA